MDYEKIYNQLIEKRRKEVLKKCDKDDPNYLYCEIHHIIPRCIGGSDDEANKIALTAREHYIAHLLLRRMHPDCYALSVAVEFMQVDPAKYVAGNNAACSRKFRFNGRLYQLIREENARMKSVIQSNLKWIKNLSKNDQKFWPKDVPLTQQMIDEGWEFGRLPFKTQRSPESYANSGYEAGKYIRVTNDVEDRYILKDDPIPEGYHRGMSLTNRQHQSQACIGRKGTTTGKVAIVKDDLSATRYILPEDELPNGWHYGSKLKGTHRSEEFKKMLSDINKGKVVADSTKEKLSAKQKRMRWYTDGITSIRLDMDAEVPIGFRSGRVLKPHKAATK